jgi:hypothetical protein
MSRHQVLGTMRVGEVCKVLYGETLQPPIFPSPRSMPNQQHTAPGLLKMLDLASVVSS